MESQSIWVIVFMEDEIDSSLDHIVGVSKTHEGALKIQREIDRRYNATTRNYHSKYSYDELTEFLGNSFRKSCKILEMTLNVAKIPEFLSREDSTELKIGISE